LHLLTYIALLTIMATQPRSQFESPRVEMGFEVGEVCRKRVKENGNARRAEGHCNRQGLILTKELAVGHSGTYWRNKENMPVQRSEWSLVNEKLQIEGRECDPRDILEQHPAVWV